jgi:glycosyltransferase involved in cell wall biosynthesis
MDLLILNYSMSPDNLVFSHQRNVVNKLSTQFERTTVITADSNLGPSLSHVTVLSSQWRQNQNLRNALRFLRIVFPIIWRGRRNLVVFTHMAEVFAFLIAPICWFFKIPNHLWYAHASKSLYLKFSFPFLSSVITSTVGSCPIRSSKVKVIGQAIRLDEYEVVDSPVNFPPRRWYHVSRLDPSKNIEAVIEAILIMRQKGFDMCLDIYGAPSSHKFEQYSQQLRTISDKEDYQGWLRFRGPILHSKLLENAQKYDGFIHAFQGSLDKSLLEAIAAKRFVVSCNNEYRDIFGIQSKGGVNPSLELTEDIEESIEFGQDFIRSEIERKFKILRRNHSQEQWLDKLKVILYGGNLSN